MKIDVFHNSQFTRVRVIVFSDTALNTLPRDVRNYTRYIILGRMINDCARPNDFTATKTFLSERVPANNINSD